jgi:cytochrome c peroxidase
VVGLAVALSITYQNASAETGPNSEIYLAPGWGKLSFVAPAPGTYSLPAIGAAADGTVLKSNGDSVQLHDLMNDKLTVLSFVYRTCDDVNGCPLSTMVLYTLGKRIAADPALKDRLRLLTLSFDPEFDTPEVMAEYGDSIVGEANIDWEFLTTGSETELAPILKAYQQSVVKDNSPSSEADGAKQRNRFSHILRVYLIDEQKQIRNIYSLSFLHPDILVNDVTTLLMEAHAKSED